MALDDKSKFFSLGKELKANGSKTSNLLDCSLRILSFGNLAKAWCSRVTKLLKDKSRVLRFDDEVSDIVAFAMNES